MAVPVGRAVVLDTNVFIDYLRAGLHDDWVLARRRGGAVRFLSATVLFELRVGATTPRRARAVDALRDAFPSARRLAPTVAHHEVAARVVRELGGQGPSGGAFERDALIAALARSLGATVVTSNVGDFARIATVVHGLAVAHPSDPET